MLSLNLTDLHGDWNLPDGYKLLEIIGQGQYGKVAHIVHEEDNSDRALKRYELIYSDELKATRFLKEIRLLKKLKHTCLSIPKEIYSGTTDDAYVSFAKAEMDLYQFIESERSFTKEKAISVIYQILCAVRYLHKSGMIHRDLKPENILLDPSQNRAYVCDYGLMRDTEAEEVLTKHVATRWYRAPEVILFQPYDSKIDIWSIGCIFAEILSTIEFDKEPEYQVEQLFPGKSCFPMSPAAEDPAIEGDDLDQFTFSQVIGAQKNEKPLEIEQLDSIFYMRGKPSEEETKWLTEEAQEFLKGHSQDYSQVKWNQLYPDLDPEIYALLDQLLEFDPSKRISAEEAIKNPIFDSIRVLACEDETFPSFEPDRRPIPTSISELKTAIEIELKTK